MKNSNIVLRSPAAMRTSRILTIFDATRIAPKNNIVGDFRSSCATGDPVNDRGKAIKIFAKFAVSISKFFMRHPDPKCQKSREDMLALITGGETRWVRPVASDREYFYSLLYCRRVVRSIRDGLAGMVGGCAHTGTIAF